MSHNITCTIFPPSFLLSLLTVVAEYLPAKMNPKEIPSVLVEASGTSIFGKNYFPT